MNSPDRPAAGGAETGMTRRSLGVGAAAATAAAALPGLVALPNDAHPAQGPPSRRPPSMFVSHGAPSLALDSERGADLRAWGTRLDRPDALVVISAHWERTPLTIGTSVRRELLHDYGGFAPALRDVTYAAPAAEAIATRLERSLITPLGSASGGSLGAIRREDTRAWDHGVWVPLVHMFPRANVPVIQLSLTSRLPPRDLFALGARIRAALGPKTLIVGSGGSVHNLSEIDLSEQSDPQGWAIDFDSWTRSTIERGDADALLDFKKAAPGFHLAHPTPEHWLPMLVVAGAGSLGEGPPGAASFPVGGFEYGSLGRLGVEF
ncbi:MAG: class III extradiol ring-cleavage dioxygenase [Planctomycetota bacterium]